MRNASAFSRSEPSPSREAEVILSRAEQRRASGPTFSISNPQPTGPTTENIDTGWNMWPSPPGNSQTPPILLKKSMSALYSRRPESSPLGHHRLAASAPSLTEASLRKVHDRDSNISLVSSIDKSGLITANLDQASLTESKILKNCKDFEKASIKSNQLNNRTPSRDSIIFSEHSKGSGRTSYDSIGVPFSPVPLNTPSLSGGDTNLIRRTFLANKGRPFARSRSASTNTQVPIPQVHDEHRRRRTLENFRRIVDRVRFANKLFLTKVRPYHRFVPRVLYRFLADDLDNRTPFESGTVKHGAIMFADCSGFTPLTELLAVKGKEGAEELCDIIKGFFQVIIDIAHVSHYMISNF